MRPPRRLSSEETAIWRKVAQTVTPLERRRPKTLEPENPQTPALPASPIAPSTASEPRKAAGPMRAAAKAVPAIHPGPDRIGLDGSWERKISKGALEPEFSLDLHGAGLDAAYVRLMRGLAQAKAMGARVVLVVTGKPRPVEAADRGRARGAIRAKIADWLAASEHASDIAAIRSAHKRHGGQGALYVVLKRRR